MRFRASIENVITFSRIVQSIEKLQKAFIMKLSEATMQIICNDSQNDGGIQVWSQIKVESLFTSYRIQSNANNEIAILVHSDALLAALRSPNPSGGGGTSYEIDEIVMKLAKKSDQAVLSFEINASTQLNRKAKVTHDVKIEVLKPQDVDRLQEPLCPEPNAHIILPPLPKLRTVVDRLRPLSGILAVQANENGVFQLSIATESVKVNTEWKNCINPKTTKSETSQDMEPPDPDQLAKVLVSTRSFLKFLNTHVVSTTTIACICQHHCLILYVYIGDVANAGGVLTFYIPAIVDDELLA